VGQSSVQINMEGVYVTHYETFNDLTTRLPYFIEQIYKSGACTLRLAIKGSISVCRGHGLQTKSRRI
jgi:hypothetical protein